MAWSPLWLCPLPAHELPVPAKERLGRHDQTVPASRREHPSERREESAIGPAKRGPRLLSPEHDQLMSQHEQLDILGELPAPAPYEQPQHRQEHKVSK